MTLLAHADHEQSIIRCTTRLSSRCFWSDCWVERLSLSPSSWLDGARFSRDFYIASGIPDYCFPCIGRASCCSPRKGTLTVWYGTCRQCAATPSRVDWPALHLPVIQQSRPNQHEANRPDPRRNRTVFFWKPQLEPTRPSREDGDDTHGDVAQLN